MKKQLCLHVGDLYNLYVQAKKDYVKANLAEAKKRFNGSNFTISEIEERLREYKFEFNMFINSACYAMIGSFFDGIPDEYKKDKSKFMKDLDFAQMASLLTGLNYIINEGHKNITMMYEPTSGALKNAYRTYGNSAGRFIKDQYKIQNKILPSTALKKMKTTFVKNTYGNYELDIDNYENIYKDIRAKVDWVNSYPNGIEIKKDWIKSLQKDIGEYMSRIYLNKKGGGELQGLLYRNFYGLSHDELKDKLKSNGIKVKNDSLNDTFNENHLNYKLVMLLVIKNIIDDKTCIYDEENLRVMTAMIGTICKDIFTNQYKNTPINNLTEIKKEVKKYNEYGEDDQLSLPGFGR